MSNETIRELGASSGLFGSISPEGSPFRSEADDSGHPSEIEDIVDIGFPPEKREQVAQADTIDKILETIGLNDKKEEAREEIYKYQKLPGERQEQGYMFAAARAAMIDLMQHDPQPETEGEILRVFATFFSQNIQSKELNPFNRPDTKGEGTYEVKNSSKA